MIYQEELNAIRGALNKIEGLQTADPDAREETATEQSYEAVEDIAGILAKVKVEGITEQPDLQDTKRGLVYDLEAIAHKILVETGRYWRNDENVFMDTSDFSDEMIGCACNLLDSISDANAALLATMREADQESGSDQDVLFNDPYSDEVFTCSICGKRFKGFGNNPAPVTNGENDRCCDVCNESIVIPARMKAAVNQAMKQAGTDQETRSEPKGQRG